MAKVAGPADTSGGVWVGAGAGHPCNLSAERAASSGCIMVAAVGEVSRQPCIRRVGASRKVLAAIRLCALSLLQSLNHTYRQKEASTGCCQEEVNSEKSCKVNTDAAQTAVSVMTRQPVQASGLGQTVDL
ncbi:hypothetical protein H920_13216 [Fukomys damarensis]|uniref:Uncharacterized protein n=1 Tax=Fukomys damarensis TaxID=885580 RepID=A0A091D5B1_FUKDA|nr:hypothetical protein H920_13216 [Fukomys damarensis]